MKRVNFTDDIRERVELSGFDLSSVQFFNAEEILLVRELEDDNTKVSKGIVILKDGKYFEHIKISKNTPGIFRQKNGERLMIAFEEGSLQYLPFEKPKYYGNYFKLSHDRRDGGDYYVEYDGVEYLIIGDTKLLYRPLKRNKINNSYRSAKGMKVDDSIFNLDKKIKNVKEKKKSKKERKKNKENNKIEKDD